MSEFSELLKLKNKNDLKEIAISIAFREPRILTIMKNDNLQLCSPVNIKYFKKPNLESFPLDLNIGYNKYKFRNESYFSFNLRKLEKYLMDNDGRSLLKQNNEKQKICTSRNVLVTIMLTPYRKSKRYEWSLKAIKFGNVIYLTKFKEQERENSKIYTYPYKLQQYCFSDSPGQEPKTDEAVNENNQISCILQNEIGNFEIFYSAEMMGIESEHEILDFNEEVLNHCNFVLTKLLTENPLYHTSRTHQSALVWYLQGKLTRADKVYVGVRDNEGFVNRELEEFNVVDLPNGQQWKPDVCKGFLYDFLLQIKSIMSGIDSPYTTVTIQFNANSKEIEYKICEETKYNDQTFLTKTFIQYMNKK